VLAREHPDRFPRWEVLLHSTFRTGMLKIDVSMKYPKTAGKFLRFFDEKVPE
jgi:hypothetical protein